MSLYGLGRGLLGMTTAISPESGQTPLRPFQVGSHDWNRPGVTCVAGVP